jgi:hypothetical protein
MEMVTFHLALFFLYYKKDFWTFHLIIFVPTFLIHKTIRTNHVIMNIERNSAPPPSPPGPSARQKKLLHGQNVQILNVKVNTGFWKGTAISTKCLWCFSTAFNFIETYNKLSGSRIPLAEIFSVQLTFTRADASLALSISRPVCDFFTHKPSFLPSDSAFRVLILTKDCCVRRHTHHLHLHSDVSTYYALL